MSTSNTCTKCDFHWEGASPDGCFNCGSGGQPLKGNLDLRKHGVADYAKWVQDNSEETSDLQFCCNFCNALVGDTTILGARNSHMGTINAVFAIHGPSCPATRMRVDLGMENPVARMREELWKVARREDQRRSEEKLSHVKSAYELSHLLRMGDDLPVFSMISDDHHVIQGFELDETGLFYVEDIDEAITPRDIERASDG